MSILPPLEELQASEEEHAPAVEEHGPVEGSLQHRLQQQREKLESQETRDFDVPGYEGTLVARYHLLGWKAHRAIANRNQKERDASLGELYTAADTLVQSCDELLEYRSDGDHEPTGYKWGARVAQELFGKDVETARQGILACFPREPLLITHYGEVMEWQTGKAPDVDHDLAGESEAGSTGV